MGPNPCRRQKLQDKIQARIVDKGICDLSQCPLYVGPSRSNNARFFGITRCGRSLFKPARRTPKNAVGAPGKIVTHHTSAGVVGLNILAYASSMHEQAFLQFLYCSVPLLCTSPVINTSFASTDSLTLSLNMLCVPTYSRPTLLTLSSTSQEESLLSAESRRHQSSYPQRSPPSLAH